MLQDRSNRELLAIFGPGILVTLVGFLLAWHFVGPPPPNKLIFASGSSWGAYYRYAQDYARLLEQDGVHIEVLQTRGSTDNLRLLLEGKADLALVQGGILPKSGHDQLICLGSVYREPLWVFARGEELRTLSELVGKRLAVGSEGSGTRAIALQLLGDNKLLSKVELLPIGGEEGEKALLRGEIDALFLVGSHTIPAVGRLMRDSRVSLLDFQRMEAYARRHHFLSTVDLPRGVMDLGRDLPAHDLRLVAPAATLVVRQSFHRALVSVILEAGDKIHGQGGILGKTGEFPSSLYCSFPVSPHAHHYFKHGMSFLYRHLPFHLACALDRMTVLLLPFLGLLIPVARLLPPIYGWTMRRKIDKRYRAIQRLEARLSLIDANELLGSLEVIEKEIGELGNMPSSFGANVHALRIHFDRVKARLAEMIKQEKTP